MRIELIPIMNLRSHGATSTMLRLDNSVHILLDCGMNQRLDFTRYLLFRDLIEKTDVILLSHSGVEYCGALPFILSKIVSSDDYSEAQ